MAVDVALRYFAAVILKSGAPAITGAVFRTLDTAAMLRRRANTKQAITMAKQGKFEVGDIVMLKSGGPDMTVNEVMTNMNDLPTGKYRCQWFAGKKLDTGVFPVESLEPVQPVKK